MSTPNNTDKDPVWWQGERHRLCQRCRSPLGDSDAIVWATTAVLLEMGGRELDRRYKTRTTRSYCSERCARRDLGWSPDRDEKWDIDAGLDPRLDTGPADPVD